MRESLFTRLASYSQNPNKRSIENFLTEVLAHLINTDRVFRRVFVRHVIPDRRMQRGFSHASALPQQTIGRGIVDLLLTGRRSKVLVEVKIGARETQTKIYGHGWVPQVRKYLSYRVGQVAFLTTRNVSSPDVKSRLYLGQFFLEHLEGELDRRHLSATGQLLLDFMEENDMKALEPFTKTDIRNAAQSFNFAKKCQVVLDEVIGCVEPAFRKIFRVRTGFTSAHFSPTYNSAYSYARKFRYGAVRKVWICLEPWEGEFGFVVYANVPKEDLGRINRHLNWDVDRSALYSWHPIRHQVEPTALARIALKDASALRRALNRVYY